MKQRTERISILKIDRFLHNFHTKRHRANKFIIIGLCFLLYVSVFLFLGELLGVSLNYFIIIPVIAITFAFGFIGGLAAGILGLPLNLLMLQIIGRPEFAPESKIIAEAAGIIIGSVMGYLSDYYYEIEEEIERRRAAESELQQSIAEKEILLHEIHHRVKNNLNIVRSLIQLQINRSIDPFFRKEADKLIGRIHSIARVHEQLYHGEKETAPSIEEYIPKLVDDIMSGIDEGLVATDYDISCPDLNLSIEQATSVGLILNEVLTNAVKYSLPLVEEPKIRVIADCESGHFIIELMNNAPTFIPKGDDFRGLGLRLIKTLSEQLDGTYEWIPGNGTTFRLRFPC